MKKIFSLAVGLLLAINISQADEKLDIEKQLIGIVGAISGTVKTETRDLKAGDKIYLNETIYATEGSGTQILLLDQSTFTIGSDSEVVMDTFIYDPATNDGKIVASVKKGSLKVISGLISKKNPDSLTVEVPEGTLGSRGTEFQTIVGKKKTDTLLIGPGKNNTLGLRPGKVLVGNKFGNTMLKDPYSVTSMTKGKAPGKAKQITKNQLKKFNKKMKALKVAKLDGATKEERKEIRKEIRKELKEAGLDKEEIKTLIKDNIQKDKEQRIVLLKERGEDVSELETVDREIIEETTAEPEIAEPEIAEPEIAKPEIEKPKVDEPKKEKVDKKDKKNKPIIRTKTITKEDGTVIKIKNVINSKTGKFTQTRTTTKPDGSVVEKKRKGKVKKKALKKITKQEKAKDKKAKKKKAKAKDNKKKPKKKAKAKKAKAKKKKAKAKDNKKKPKKKAKAKKAKAKKKKAKAKKAKAKKKKAKAKKAKAKKKKAKPKKKAKSKKKKAKKKAKPKKKKAKKKAKPKKKKAKKKAKPKKKKAKKKIKKAKKVQKKKIAKKKKKAKKKRQKKKKKAKKVQVPVSGGL